jgi:phosphate transport system substrate-binding protein
MQFIKNVYILLSLLIFVSCTGEEPTKHDETTTETNEPTNLNIVAGSETEMELVQGIIDLVNDESLSKYEVLGGGSKYGVEMFLAGKAKFANSSVRMSQGDKDALKESGRYGLMEIVFALDAVAVITNAEVGVDSMSVFELKKVYKGEITNWKELGGEDMEIIAFRRNDDSGTNEFFWNKVLQSSYGEGTSIVESNDEMLATVESTPGSIGYLGIGTIKDKEGKPSDKVWAMNVYIEGNEAKSPYSFYDVVTDNYYLARPLYQYFMIEDKEDFKALLEFELSPAGQAYIKEQGFFPITEEYAAKNQFYLEKLAE